MYHIQEAFLNTSYIWSEHLASEFPYYLIYNYFMERFTFYPGL